MTCARSAGPGVVVMVMLPLALVAARPAHALEPGWLYAGANGELAEARGGLAAQAPPRTLGWTFQFGVGPKGLPISLGLGGGAMRFSTQEGWNASAVWTRTLELRHFDVALRIEPRWRFVRPFVEATIGTAQFFTETTLDSPFPSEPFVEESSEALTFAYGFGAGLNFDVVPTLWQSSDGSVALVLSLGLRTLRGGDIDYAHPVTRGASSRLEPGRARLDMLVPFAGLFIAARPAPAPPPRPAPGPARPAAPSPARPVP